MAYFNNFLKRKESTINFKHINNGHNSSKVILEENMEFSIFFQLSLVTLCSKTKNIVNW